MGRQEQRAYTYSEVLIRKASEAQLAAGYPRPYLWLFGQINLEEVIKIANHNKELKVKPAFSGRDSILIHFNRVLPAELKSKTDEILARKYVDHIATHKFGATYAAKCFIDTIRELSEGTVPQPSEKWVGPNRLYLNEWILISSDPQSSVGLEDIMEHEYDKEEKKWKLPHPYDQYASSIARYSQGTHTQINSRTRESQGKPPLDDDTLIALGVKKKQPRDDYREHKRKEPKPVKERKAPKRDLSGMIDLAAICKPLKIEPREARQALRKSKAQKPDAGWVWPEKEKAEVTKMVEKAIKKLRAK